MLKFFKKKTTYEVLLDVHFLSEYNEDDYLHNVKRVTPNSYLKIVKKLFNVNLNEPNIVKLALPETNTLVSWKLTYEKNPTIFKLTYTTSKPLNLEEKESFNEFVSTMDDHNYVIEYYKVYYTAAVGLHKIRNKK